MVAATAMALLAAACGDALVPGGTAVDEAELVVLRVQAGTPAPAAVTFAVPNRTPSVRTLRHSDAFNTLFVELRFPAGSMSSLNGTPLSIDDTVFVTIAPTAGRYGFSLSPSGLLFTLDNTPSATFNYAVYGDLTVADGEPSFPDRAAYQMALEVWEEVSIGRWRVARGSNPSGLSELSAAVDAPGDYLLAARR